MNKSLFLGRKNTQFYNSGKKVIEFLVSAFCLITIIYLFLSALFIHDFSVINLINARKQTSFLENNVATLTQENERYVQENKRLLNDDFFIESIARREYLMVKEGEKVYIFKSR